MSLDRVKRRRRLADIDIGPRTRRLQAVRDGVRGVRAALDRDNCRDAAAIMKLTLTEAKKLPNIDFNTLYWLNEERQRFSKSCRMKLSGQRRRSQR